MKKILTVVMCIVMCIVILLVFICCSETVVKVTDIDHYLQFSSRPLTQLEVFPKNFDNILQINQYFHNGYIRAFGGEDEIYFDVLYSEENFKNELNRLENFTYTNRFGETKSIKKDAASLFNYPTYISVYNFLGKFEYVCVDEANQRMIYIALWDIPYEMVTIDGKYLPKNYENIYNDENSYVYNVYVKGQLAP